MARILDATLIAEAHVEVETCFHRVCVTHATQVHRIQSMNHSFANLISTTPMTACVPAKRNVPRIVAIDRHKIRCDQARMEFCSEAHGRSQAATCGIGRFRYVYIAVLFCGVMPSSVFAEVSAKLRFQNPSPASPMPTKTKGHEAVSSASDQPSAEREVSNPISAQLNLDFTNAYFYRGIRQQDKGLIIQPAARFTTRLADDGEFKLDGFVGTWNSFGPNAGTQKGGLIEDWYESDLYAGVTLSQGCLSFTTSYTFLTSPSDAFQSVQEFGISLAIDESEWMKDRALKPYASLGIETGSNGSDGPDLDNGVYIEFGIAPDFSFDLNETPITLTFPAAVGLSLSDYYQDTVGKDDTLGFAQVGAKASIPLLEPSRAGAWTLNASMSVLYLGDHTKAFNDGDGMEVIGTVGLQWNF